VIARNKQTNKQTTRETNRNLSTVYIDKIR